jgi:hypothetical protein
MLRAACRLFGFSPHMMKANLRGAPRFVRDLIRYRRLNSDATFHVSLREIYPVLHESKSEAGTILWDYFHQDLWAARRIFGRRPALHFDIGSRVDGFIAHLLTFMPVCLIDIRPLHEPIENLSVIVEDATRLARFGDDSIESLSSLHAVEHFGLGRYSDPVRPDAWATVVKSMQRVLAPDGRLYFSVPIGRQRVEFNAHRVFAVQTILDAFDRLELVSFSFVDEKGRLFEEFPLSRLSGIGGGCGLFEFTKRPPAAESQCV